MQNNRYKHRLLAISLMAALGTAAGIASPAYSAAISTPTTQQQTLNGEITTRSPMNANDGSRYQKLNVRLQGGQFVRFKLNGPLEGVLSLQNNKGLLIGSASNSDSLFVEIPTTDRYHLNVSGSNSNSYGPFEVNVSILNIQNTGELAENSEVIGILTQNNSPNIYTFTVAQTQSYRFDLIADDFDTKLELSGAGIDVSDDDGGDGLNSRITAALQPGTYQLKAKGYSNSAEGQYTLSTQTRTLPPGVVIQSGGELRPDQEVAGLFSGQAHTFTLNVSQRSLATINMESDSLDTLLKLNGPGINLEDDDGGGDRNSRIVTVLEPGRYTVSAGTYNNRGSDLYTLKATLSEVIANSNNTLRPGSSRNGQLYTGSNDVVSLRITQAGTYVIDMISSDFDSKLTITGQGISNTDDDSGDGVNAQLSLYLEPGTYQLLPTGYSSSATGQYVINVSNRR